MKNSFLNSSLVSRIVLDICIFLCLVYGWWFVALPLGVAGLWFMPYYAELIIGGVLYDALFGYGYTGTILAVVLSVLAYAIKKIVRKS